MRRSLFTTLAAIFSGFICCDVRALDYATIANCSQQTLIGAGLRANLSEIAYTLESEKAPFNFACKSDDATKGRPKTWLFKRDVPLRDRSGHLSSDFLKIIEDKVRTKITENRNMANAVKTCIAASPAEPICSEIKDWVTNVLPDYVGSARFHLSLAQSAHQAKTWFGETSVKVNAELDSLGSPKLKSWTPLTTKEKAQAEAAMKIYQEQIRKEHKSATDAEKKEALLVLRYQHFEQYQAMMAQLPFLQFMDSPNPTNKEILDAVDKLEKSIQKEEEALNKITLALKETPPGTGSLDLLKYSTLVEEVLIERPEYCAIASSLVFTSDNRELGNALAIGLPILAVSIFAPPIAMALGAGGAAATGIGIGVGLVGGAGFIYDSQRLLDQERVRSFSQFYGDEGGMEMEQVRIAESLRDFQVVTAPLVFAGAGTLAKTVLVHKGAIKMASQIQLAKKKP